MKGTVHRRAGARQDLVEIYRRLAREAGMRTADRFLAATESTFQRLARMPSMGTRYETGNAAFGELRFFPLPSRFKKYIVFYRTVQDGIEIARVLHGARDLSAILTEEFSIGDGNGDHEEKEDD